MKMILRSVGMYTNIRKKNASPHDSDSLSNSLYREFDKKNPNIYVLECI